jgi:hypothetical protein
MRDPFTAIICCQRFLNSLISKLDMPKWFLKSIEITGGFLPGLSLQFPRGLTCIIGPRGSGKSTLSMSISHNLAQA